MKVSDKHKKRLINILTLPVLCRKWRKSLREQLKCVFIYRTMKFADIFGCTYQKFTDNPQAKTFLLIDEKIPVYDRDTGSRVIWQYLSFFKKQGLNVYYMPMLPFPKGKYLQSLNDMQINVITEDKETWLQKYGSGMDYVMLDRPDIAEKMLPILKKYIKVPIWYFDHDLHYVRERRNFEQTGDTEALRRSEAYKELEDKITEQTDVFLTLSDYEAKIVNKTHPNKPSMVLPIYIWKEFPQAEYNASKREGLMFVGSSHLPNADAMRWFLDEIFPQFIKHYPKAKFYIVGGSIPADIKKQASANVIFTGFISDDEMNALMNKVRLNVVPLRFGAGVKGKIVESVYQKLPVITTPVGAEGIPATPMITVSDTRDFTDNLISLYSDTDKLNNAVKTADDFLQNNYSEAVMCKVFEDLKGIKW